jgi:hypothetical protein
MGYANYSSNGIQALAMLGNVFEADGPRYLPISAYIPVPTTMLKDSTRQ